MNAVAARDDHRSATRTLLCTLVVTDLVDGLALIERIGDRPAAELIRRHDRMVRSVGDRHGGREIDKTDGFLMMFDRPIQAVAFALDYQRSLRRLNASETATLASRVGIHVGDILVWDNAPEDVARGAKPVEVEGLVKPIASRLMNLALPGQILLSNIAYALAHRAQGELGVQLERVHWRRHGRYRFRGIPDPIAVVEVGEEGLAPLKTPSWSGTAHREIPLWRRPGVMAAAALALAAIIAVPVSMIVRPSPSIAFTGRDWVVIGSLDNLTGQTVFDESLQGALRLALEQSRHVNVLPDLRVRDTIKHMRRDPDATRLDRVVGSEVAIRAGAKALVLPTLVEVGGRMRVTAELIDPRTRTTVYSESADGVGAESVLSSLDLVNRRLRIRLGEALATVGEASEPLDKVATQNLDALRAYSLATRHYASGSTSRAMALYQEAVKMDPDFAAARLQLATLYFTESRTTEARRELDLALDEAQRLSTRDRIVAEATRANFGSQEDALKAWRAAAAQYPDLFSAQGSLAFYTWHYANDFAAAIDAVRANVVPQNPNRGLGHYLLGTLLVGTERYAEGLAEFDAATALGVSFGNLFVAAAHSARRDHATADAVLASGRAPERSVDTYTERVFALARALDRGHWTEAASLQAAGEEHERDAAHAHAWEVSRLVAAGLVDDDRDHVTARLALAASRDRQPGTGVDRTAWATRMLVRAWLAARLGDDGLAGDAIDLARPVVDERGVPVLAKLMHLVQVERLNHGDPAAVVHLRALLDGTELYASHVLLMERLAATRDFAGAQEQARWLATHRGRAYMEVIDNAMFKAWNVAQSNLAVLREAEFAARLGELAEARSSLRRFLAIWPVDGMPSRLHEDVDRVRALIEALAAADMRE